MGDATTEKYSSPRLLKRTSQSPVEVDLPWADKAGYQRTWLKGLQTRRSFARIIVVPARQTTPVHGTSCDHIVFGVSGIVVFEMNGDRFTLEAGDLLFFPANILYTLSNPQERDAEFLSVGIESQFGWPAVAHYWLPSE
jgi:mannose-6-phosphate isomerase-like protein (cupin superfamily)